MAAWEVSAENEAALDRYEGFPTFYYKKEMELPLRGIRTGKVRLRKVFVYIMHEDRPLGVPSGFYMETCRQGYRSFGFDEAFLERAYEQKHRATMRRRAGHVWLIRIWQRRWLRMKANAPKRKVFKGLTPMADVTPVVTALPPPLVQFAPSAS